jgi:hypothetical protein
MGRTREEVEHEMHDAIEFHIEGLCLAGEEVPTPRSEASYCDVAASCRRSRYIDFIRSRRNHSSFVNISALPGPKIRR